MSSLVRFYVAVFANRFENRLRGFPASRWCVNWFPLFFWSETPGLCCCPLCLSRSLSLVSWLWNLSGGRFLVLSNKAPAVWGSHVFEGLSRKMNLLFDTLLPLCYCEIRLAPVSVSPDRGACVCVCLFVCVQGVFCRTAVISAFEMWWITSSTKNTSICWSHCNPVGWCW